MGSSVSTGVDNDDLVDNLIAANYIKTPSVERVFRAVDRGMYFTALERENAYKDLAWKSRHGNIHISAPCIYCEVMENLNLGPGMSFLNLGSGTGYLSTMAGLILGSYGTNHGVEIHADVIQYAQEKLKKFKTTSPAIEEFDFCEPKFVEGNCLLLDTSSTKYDRVYCGAACPPSYESYMKNLLKVGGILVMPLDDNLQQITRVSETSWKKISVLRVAFANLVEPSKADIVTLPKGEPVSLMDACRTSIRNILQTVIIQEHPELKVPTEPLTLGPLNKAGRNRTYQRIFIPIPIEFYEGASGTTSPNPFRIDQSSSTSSDQDMPDGLNSITRSDQRSSSDSDESDTTFVTTTFRDLQSIQAMQAMANRTINSDSDSSSHQVAADFPSVSERNAADEVGSSLSDSSVPLDDSSDSMDVDQVSKDAPGPSSRKAKSEHDGCSKRMRKKRKEMDESDCSGQALSTSHRSQAGSNSSNESRKNQCSEAKEVLNLKRRSGAKREKVDSGLGEDIKIWDSSSSESACNCRQENMNNSDISQSDGGSEEDLESGSGSDDDVPKSGKKLNVFGEARKRKPTQKSKEISPYVKFMRLKVQQLPLPPSMKSFINYYRDM